MASGQPSGSAGPSGSNVQRLPQVTIQQQASQSSNPGNIYSFSVHQPYTNWPLHASGTPYAPSWYPLPPQAYGHPKAYKEAQTQTDGRGVSSDAEVQYRRHWDAVLSTFLKNAGLHQSLRGFKDDMMMMSEKWEKEKVPIALEKLVKDLSEIAEDAKEEASLLEKPLDDRRLDYVRTPPSIAPQSPSDLTKSISKFLKESRKRNDASNRSEFLLSLAEKRRKLNEHRYENSTQNRDRPVETSGEGSSVPAESLTDSTGGEDIRMGEAATNSEPSAPPESAAQETSSSSSSCARTDAKPQNRDMQMKYDIAKNEDGPLKRTMKGNSKTLDAIPDEKGKQRAIGVSESSSSSVPTAERHPGLTARFKDIETHLAVRYVPSPPYSLIDRIKFLEDHIIKLEKDYPPWAALHFNQPNRGWPAPPRLTPIIVAPHLTSTKAEDAVPPTAHSGDGMAVIGARSTGKAKPKAKSSLHRAVMEKLEIQRAIGDLAGGSGG